MNEPLIPKQRPEETLPLEGEPQLGPDGAAIYGVGPRLLTP